MLPESSSIKVRGRAFFLSLCTSRRAEPCASTGKACCSRYQPNCCWITFSFCETAVMNSTEQPPANDDKGARFPIDVTVGA